MKAAICYKLGQPLVIEEIVIDAPQAGELKVKLSACAICHSDIHYMEGAWGGTLPAVYGHEAAGIVEEVGVGVATMAPGDHVIVSLLRSCGKCHFCERNESYMCEAKFALDSETRLHTTDGKPIHPGLRTGAFAEAVVVEQSQVVPIPADVSFDSASLLACGVITGLGEEVVGFVRSQYRAAVGPKYWMPKQLTENWIQN
jgi:S-(hydroxymethyl)glutathione dehydrogenase/alcohol dehydrogenase